MKEDEEWEELTGGGRWIPLEASGVREWVGRKEGEGERGA